MIHFLRELSNNWFYNDESKNVGDSSQISEIWSTGEKVMNNILYVEE